MANWYVGSTKYTAVATWTALTTYSVGNIVRQLATPAVNSERCFRVSAITTGISGAAEPSWTLTKNGTTTDSGVTWTECTGQALYNGDGGGSAYAAPHARVANAINTSWSAAGDNIYVSNNHAETQASAISISSSNGTVANNMKVICVSDAAVPPTTTATSATVSTTGSNDISLAAPAVYWYGIKFNSGNAINVVPSGGNQPPTFDTCTLTLNNASAGTFFWFGSSNVNTTEPAFLNCAFVFGASTQTFGNSNTGEGFYIYGGSVAATGTVPSTCFTATSRTCSILVRDCDLSAITGNIVGGNVQDGGVTIENCAVGVAATLNAASLSTYNSFVKVLNCDSSATNYRYYFSAYGGTVQQETTIVRTGGATNGTTPISWNITSGTNLSYYQPFITEEIVQWNDTSGSAKTVTVYLTSNSTLTNQDVWIEVEYLSSASNPLGALTTTKVSIFGTPATLTTDASTWGGAITNKYKIVSSSFTPQSKGPVKVRIGVSKASTTVYVDPLLTIA